MKKKYNFIVINFFRVTNPYSGASEISYNFFKNIPSKNKKLIQLSNIKQKENKIETILAKSKYEKILRILDMAKLTEQYCKNKKYPVIIIEGASWVGILFYFIYFKEN